MATTFVASYPHAFTAHDLVVAYDPSDREEPIRSIHVARGKRRREVPRPLFGKLYDWALAEAQADSDYRRAEARADNERGHGL